MTRGNSSATPGTRPSQMVAMFTIVVVIARRVVGVTRVELNFSPSAESDRSLRRVVHVEIANTLSQAVTVVLTKVSQQFLAIENIEYSFTQCLKIEHFVWCCNNTHLQNFFIIPTSHENVLGSIWWRHKLINISAIRIVCTKVFDEPVRLQFGVAYTVNYIRLKIPVRVAFNWKSKISLTPNVLWI